MAGIGQEFDENELHNAGFICPICLEIFTNPIVLSCGNNHVYCEECVLAYQHTSEPECPECRQPFCLDQVCHAIDLMNRISSAVSRCKWCGLQLTLPDLKRHLKICQQQNTKIEQFKPIGCTSQTIPSNLPNRLTFQCPLCDQQNLTCQDLVQHCNDNHRKVKTNMVCPVCKAMPWGDPNLQSSDFLQHLNVRHKFEYDTFVDYEQDDEEMLRQAIEASMKHY
ncbi:E3 ubiquitin-protein ligase RNF166-like [Ylistrum balloti]|uniref:E3 ubiquitin-protein ligase RNF166-like n=1 Tax=Ylistrum balloti TaxID=509963 RepID=UPI00290582A0|nr:E3 ubiquitin-protein ligase RNF166-like [Ylistrum balloti]